MLARQEILLHDALVNREGGFRGPVSGTVHQHLPLRLLDGFGNLP